MKATLNIPDALGAHALNAALEGLVEVGMSEMVEPANVGYAGGIPPLYQSGVQYRRERNTEDWQPPSEVIAAGWGDCEDLAAYRTAELRVSGEDPTAVAQVIRSGPRTWHAVVSRDNGTYIEDPSSVLGMGHEDEGTLAGWDFRCARVPGGYQCTLMRDGAGVVGFAPLASGAISRACSQGEVGQIPGLDILSRIAQGALSAVVPATATAAPYRPTGTTAATSYAVPAIPGVPTELAPDVQRIAQQIASLTSREARRKLTLAQRSVR